MKFFTKVKTHLRTTHLTFCSNQGVLFAAAGCAAFAFKQRYNVMLRDTAIYILVAKLYEREVSKQYVLLETIRRLL